MHENERLLSLRSCSFLNAQRAFTYFAQFAKTKWPEEENIHFNATPFCISTCSYFLQAPVLLRRAVPS